MFDDHVMQIDVSEAADRLEELIDMLDAGTVRSVLITRNERPAAMLTLVPEAL